jgi:hypothetical protein
MSGPTDFDVARIYLRPQRQLPLVSTAVSGFAQRQQRELPKTRRQRMCAPNSAPLPESVAHSVRLSRTADPHRAARGAHGGVIAQRRNLSRFNREIFFLFTKCQHAAVKRRSESSRWRHRDLQAAQIRSIPHRLKHNPIRRMTWRRRAGEDQTSS